MALLIGGIYLRMDVHVNRVVTAAYSQHDAHLFHLFCYATITAGAVLTFVGFLGCCSAYQESTCMLAAVSSLHCEKYPHIRGHFSGEFSVF